MPADIITLPASGTWTHITAPVSTPCCNESCHRHYSSCSSTIQWPTRPVAEAHMFEPHFDRRVWTYRENPNGVFTPLDPAVSCANHRVTTAHVHCSH